MNIAILRWLYIGRNKSSCDTTLWLWNIPMLCWQPGCRPA